jgi:ABC-type bacteriocin/lantibiotic exporter with double-glycine peptidase domain
LEEDGEPIRFEHGAGIRLSDVTFAYDGHSRKILQHATYDFAPGSTTAILGETGAGKTTLIRLILSLLQPDEGVVEMYDDHGSVPVSARTRCNLVYVPQGNSLFSGTIRWNLLMGNPEATESEMREALHQACADFVFTLPDGMDTLVGEGGAGLSEGQAQRIAIARALLRRGSILLLDAATSALDQQTERQLLTNLTEHHRKLPVQPTLIFITHRSAVLEHCSQVITLSKRAIPVPSR